MSKQNIVAEILDGIREIHHYNNVKFQLKSTELS